jgi:uncharacterized protein DUF5313
MATPRPNPVLWVYYQFGGTLPDRYGPWVLHDGTCRTWLVRVFLRGLVMVSPVAAGLFTVFLLLGHSLPLALGSIVLGLLVSLRYSGSYAVESVDRRLAGHGYPREYGSTVRREAYDAAHVAEAERYRAVYRPTEE